MAKDVQIAAIHHGADRAFADSEERRLIEKYAKDDRLVYAIPIDSMATAIFEIAKGKKQT